MYSSVSTIWVLLGAALVFLMQAGFAMCEAGFTRAKNTCNILMKNLMDFCIGTPTYWLLGFGLMFAGPGAIIGGLDPFVRGDYSAVLPAGVPLFAYLIFQTVFCATSATIVSGAMAERTRFISYCLYSFCISAFIYPVSGHWIWGGGWLDILCKMERFDALKRAMFNIGITGMTATNVMGCGEQRGKTEGYFRGAKVEATMLPSIQVSIVVSKVPVSLVVETARKVLYTGAFGDGKIFVYNVENVVKVRTGVQGYDALQDEEAK